MKHKEVFIFCISRELLNGSVVDKNAAFMAGRVTDLGFRVRQVLVLDSVEEEQVRAFKWALTQNPAYILTTGGMGPGFDDVTRESVAAATGSPLELSEHAEEMLRTSYRRLKAKNVVEDAEITETRRRMAMVPKGSESFENPIGTAPLVRMEHENTVFFMMPGVPAEMQRLFNLTVRPALEKDGTGIVRETRTVDYFGRDESVISRMLHDLERRHPNVAARAKHRGSEENNTIRISLYGENTSEAAVKAAVEDAEADLRARLGLEVARAAEAEQ